MNRDLLYKVGTFVPGTGCSRLWTLRSGSFSKAVGLEVDCCLFWAMRLLISGIGVFTLWHDDPLPPAWAMPGHPVLEAGIL